MKEVLFIFLLFAMITTLLTLIWGVFTMTRQSKDHPKRTNRLMRLRVYLQGLALILFALAMISS